MIVYSDRGATLRCTGCDAWIELKAGEIADPFRSAERRQAMARVHGECESYRDKQKAREVIKRRRAMYQKAGVDRAMPRYVRKAV